VEPEEGLRALVPREALPVSGSPAARSDASRLSEIGVSAACGLSARHQASARAPMAVCGEAECKSMAMQASRCRGWSQSSRGGLTARGTAARQHGSSNAVRVLKVDAMAQTKGHSAMPLGQGKAVLCRYQ
jgi:hypothetical protein